MQIGGVVIGEGGFGSVHTLDDLDGVDSLMLYSVDVRRGRLRRKQMSGKDLFKMFGYNMVYKNYVTRDNEHEAAGNSIAAGNNDAGVTKTRDLTDFVREWSAVWKYSDERVTWKVSSNVAQKKVRQAPVDSLMPLHRQGDDIFLSFVIGNRMHPLYRYMHGDLSMFIKYYRMTLRHVFQLAESVVKTCQLLLRSGFHHCDIKPYNVLFRITDARDFDRTPVAGDEQSAYHKDLASRTKGRVEFVLSDYGTAVWEPKTMKEVWTMAGTAGYLSPLAYSDYYEFKHEFDERATRSCIPPALTAPIVWDSYAEVMSSPPRAMIKNDIYALGVTLMYFQLPSDVQQLAVDMMLGSSPLWTFEAVLGALASTKKAYRGELGERVVGRC